MVKSRVAIVTNIPSPYRIPAWVELSKRVSKLLVLCCAERDPNRVWRFDDNGISIRVLPGRQWYVANRDWGVYWNPSIIDLLKSFEPTHIIVTGYEAPTYLMAILYARAKDIPLTIWWGSHVESSRSRKGPIPWFRKSILRLASSFVTYGTLATAYLRSIGIPESRIVTGTNAVDVERLGRLVDNYHEHDTQVNSQVVRFLYVGQFIERKGLRQLIQAFRCLPKEKASLTLVGYGPLDSELRQYACKNEMNNLVFAGATKTLDETARFYAEADVLVMPSLREVWGLVVNEALASGLFVLASSQAGATRDLIDCAPLLVGMGFDPHSQNGFQDVLKKALEAAPLRNVARIKSWGRLHTPRSYAESVIMALSKVK